MSLGDGGNYRDGSVSGLLDDEIAQLEAMGVSVVSASGNSFSAFDPALGQSYPAANSTLGVGSVWTKDFGGWYYWSSGEADYTTGADRLVSHSQRNADHPNQVLAPGDIITSTYLYGGLADMAGTSMASPHVAGLVALVQDAALEFGGRTLTSKEVVSILRSTAETVYDGDNENDNVANTNRDYLRIDAFAAVEAVYNLFHPTEIRGTKFEDRDGDGVRDTGEPTLPGWTIYIDTDKDGTLDAASRVGITNVSGQYVFAGLAPATYTVREVLQPAGRKPITGPAAEVLKLRVWGTAGTISEVDPTTGAIIHSFAAPGTIAGSQGLASDPIAFYIDGSPPSHTRCMN